MAHVFRDHVEMGSGTLAPDENGDDALTSVEDPPCRAQGTDDHRVEAVDGSDDRLGGVLGTSRARVRQSSVDQLVQPPL